jgi:flagellar P-ring protein precursor FlgI
VSMRTYSVTVLLLVSTTLSLALDTEPRKVAVRDIATVEGVRENPLVGYGIVVGLNGTGDRRQTMFTIQTLANALQRMGVQIPTATARVNNVAAVFVTASLPAFARPGTHLDVTVSSIGDAKSLEGGLLLLTPLYGLMALSTQRRRGPSPSAGIALEEQETQNRSIIPQLAEFRLAGWWSATQLSTCKSSTESR